MNFIGKFDPDSMRAHHDGFVVTEPNSNGEATVTISDAHLLFGGDYRRSGVDLFLSKDGNEVVVHDYFKGEKRATLASTDGASLSGRTVEALAGHVQYAQADGSPSVAQVIGHVTKLSGNATAIRNGVAIILNVGDTVNKGDVVQAGMNSSLGLTFIDGTVFGLSSNARMVLNELVYDPNGSSNNSLLTLVQGTISFVAGETAKHGDMKVDTPVATMGIRGTAVLVEIGFEVPGQGDAPPVKFQVLLEPTGVTGSYALYSKSDPTQVIGTVFQSGQLTSVTGAGNISQSQAPPLSPAALAIIQQTFEAFFPNYTPDPKSNGPGNGSTPATPVPGATDPDKLPLNLPFNTPTTLPIPINLPATPNSGTPTVIPVTVTIVKSIDVTPVVDSHNFAIPDQVRINDSNPADVLVPYVPGTARIISVSAPNAPAGVDLTQFVTVDPQTGAVSYDPARFAFLSENQRAIVIIGFDSKAGLDTFHATLSVTINGINDPPVITSASFSIDRGGVAVLASSNFVVSDPDSTAFTFHVSNVSHGSFQTTTDGVHWFDATSFTTADLNSGHVRFVQDGSAVGPTFSVTADDGASANRLSDTATGHANLTENHLPVVTVSNGTITELPGTGNIGSDTATGTITFTDADLADRPVISVTFGSGVVYNAQHVSIALSSAGLAAIAGIEGPLQLSPAPSNTNNGSAGWTYAVPDSAFDFLSAGESLVLTYVATVDDGRGHIVSEPLTITIIGANDAPVVTATGGTATHSTNSNHVDTYAATGSITFADPDLSDRPVVSASFGSAVYSDSNHHDITNTLTPAQLAEVQALEVSLALTATAGNTNNGSVAWNYSASGPLDFLAAGQTLTLNYTATVDDGHGGVVSAPFSVTIVGSNIPPVVSATNGSFKEQPGTGNTTADETSGSISFADANASDRPTVTTAFSSLVYDRGGNNMTASLTSSQIAALGSSLVLSSDGENSNNGSVTWTYRHTDSDFDFLGANDTLTLQYTATVNDGHGGVVNAPFTVTVTGTNDPAVITGSATGTVSEDGTLFAEGTLNVADPDTGENHFRAVDSASLVGTYGRFTFSALTGAWDYSLNNAAANVQALAATAVVHDSLTVTSADGTDRVIDITIHGTNDRPTIVSETDPPVRAIEAVPAAALVAVALAPTVTTNSLGLNTETFDTQTVGSPQIHGAGFGNFHSAALNATFSATGNAGVVNGSAQGITTPPFMGPAPGAYDVTNFLTIAANATETIAFAAQQNEFGLFWGAVEPDNTVEFFNGANLVASFSGAEARPLFFDVNDFSLAGNGYVQISGLPSFDRVVLVAGTHPFEIDNVSAGFKSTSQTGHVGPLTGTLTASDPDIGDTLTASVTGNAVIQYNGSIISPGSIDVSRLTAASAVTFDSVTTNGGAVVLHWVYNPNDAPIDFLRAGDTLTITYTAQIDDGHGHLGAQPLTIAIVGANTSGNNTIDAGQGGGILNGSAGADSFVFGPSLHFNSPTPPPVTHITDYNAAQGDTIDLSSATSAFHGLNVSDEIVVRAVEDNSGTFARLQANVAASGDVPRWVDVAQLEGAHVGDAVNVQVDAQAAIHLAQIHVSLLV